MGKKKIKEMQETVSKINRCYQTFDYKLKISLPLPNGSVFTVITYYQDIKKFKN